MRYIKMKYYVNIDSYSLVIHAENPYHACILSLQRKLNKYTDILGRVFRISQRGFDEHDDDEFIPTEIIINILILAQEN